MIYPNYKDSLTYLEERAATLGVEHDFEKWHLKAGEEYYVNENLNVRVGPGTVYKIIGGIDEGTFVSVIEHSYGWARINSPLQGWCHEWYLIKKKG